LEASGANTSENGSPKFVYQALEWFRFRSSGYFISIIRIS
jgi:hypothetical protein